MTEVHGNFHVTRSKPIRGGTTKCSRCDKPRVESSAYCREHRAEYQRDWRKAQAEKIAFYEAELRRLRAIAEGVK